MVLIKLIQSYDFIFSEENQRFNVLLYKPYSYYHSIYGLALEVKLLNEIA